MGVRDVTVRVKAVDETKSAFKSVKSSLGGLKNAAISVQGAIAGVVGIGTVKEVISLADAYKSVTSRLKLVSDSTNQFADAQRALFVASQNTRTNFQQTVDLYSTLRRSTKDLGVSQETIIKLTEDIGKALAVSGASGASAEAALVQLGQGFAAGALRGQEFMSVAEQAPMILDVLSKGLGKTRGELKAMADEGQITTEVFLKGFNAGSAELGRMFEQMPVTVGQALTKLQNSILLTVGTLDKLAGATQKVANAISFFSGVVDSLKIEDQQINLASLASDLIDAEKELKKYNWMLDRAKNSGLDYSETLKRQEAAQIRFNKALYKFRGAEFTGQMAPPLAVIPKKSTPALTKEQEKEQKKQIAFNEALVSQMTDIEKQKRYGMAQTYKIAEAYKEQAKATTDAYVAARNLRQNVGLSEMTKIQEVIDSSISPIQQYAQGIKTIDESLQDIALNSMKNMENAFVGLISGTMSVKDAFKSMASSIISDLIRIYVQQTITKPLAGFLGGMFGGAPSVPLSTSGPAYSSAAWASSNASWAASGARASGGPVTGGKTYLVGERGPELFTASSSGNITPNNQLGGGGVVVNQTINVTTGVQQTVRAEVMSLMPQIAGAAKAAVADAKMRGGGFAAAMR